MYANEKVRQTVTIGVFQGRVNTVDTHVETLLNVFHIYTHTHKELCLLSPASIKWFKLGTLVTRSISNEFTA